MEHFVESAYHNELVQFMEDLSCRSGEIFSFLRLLPVHLSPVYVTAVCPSARIIMVSVVVQHSDLVAAVENRYAAQRQHACVEHHISIDSPLQCFLIILII